MAGAWACVPAPAAPTAALHAVAWQLRWAPSTAEANHAIPVERTLNIGLLRHGAVRDQSGVSTALQQRGTAQRARGWERSIAVPRSHFGCSAPASTAFLRLGSALLHTGASSERVCSSQLCLISQMSAEEQAKTEVAPDEEPKVLRGIAAAPAGSIAPPPAMHTITGFTGWPSRRPALARSRTEAAAAMGPAAGGGQQRGLGR